MTSVSTKYGHFYLSADTDVCWSSQKDDKKQPNSVEGFEIVAVFGKSLNYECQK